MLVDKKRSPEIGKAYHIGVTETPDQPALENTNLLLHFVSDPSGNNAGLDFTVALVPHELTLANDDSTKPEGSKNADIISDAAEKHKVCNVTLSDRTLLKDGNWNTLCLPFDMTIAASPLAGDNVEAKVFETHRV